MDNELLAAAIKGKRIQFGLKACLHKSEAILIQLNKYQWHMESMNMCDTV